MSLVYHFNESEISQLDASRVVFNHFTQSNFDLQQFLKFTIESALLANSESAEIALKLRPSAKLYHRINPKTSAEAVH